MSGRQWQIASVAGIGTCCFQCDSVTSDAVVAAHNLTPLVRKPDGSLGVEKAPLDVAALCEGPTYIHRDHVHWWRVPSQKTIDACTQVWSNVRRPSRAEMEKFGCG